MIEDRSRAVILVASDTGVLIFPGTIFFVWLVSRSACGCSSCCCSWPGILPLAAAAVNALCLAGDGNDL